MATDAAGEGLNLQAAHLMINYDLPWNPNRIEQRFGRIHRIGQNRSAGCGIWSPTKPAKARCSPGCCRRWKPNAPPTAAMFDVLGEAFKDQPLSKLLMEAVRWDDPARQAELERVLDAEVSRAPKTCCGNAPWPASH